MSNFSWCRRPVLLALVIGALAAASWRGLVGSARADGVLDAKRKAAELLVHDGKYADAVTLLGEITAVDDSGYNDHLLLARAYEKLGQGNEAIRQYKTVLALLPGSPSSAAERAARQEADKRLKVLDPMGAKLDGAVEEIERKLAALESEALAARSMPAVERVFRLRGALWQAERRTDHGFCEVFANGAWQDSGLDLRAGQTYRIRAAGTWRVRGKNGARVECTAAGTDEAPGNYIGRIGQLEAQVGNKFHILGQDATLTPEVSGRLMLIANENDQKDRLKNTGSVQVVIEGRN
jgi:hypothetical protein